MPERAFFKSLLVSFSSESLLHFKMGGFSSGEVGLWKLFGHVEGAIEKLCLKRNLGFEDRSKLEVMAEGIEAEIARLVFYAKVILPSHLLLVRMKWIRPPHPLGLKHRVAWNFSSFSCIYSFD